MNKQMNKTRMSYEEFLKWIKADLPAWMKVKYGIDTRFSLARKNNLTYEAVSFEQCGSNISPFLNLEKIYEISNEKESDPLDVISSFFEDARSASKNMESLVPQIDEKNIIYNVVAYKGNEDFLADKPHRKFLDLAVYYRCILKNDKDNIASCAITYTLCNSMGMDEAELYECAYENQVYVTKGMTEILKEEMIKDGISEDIIDSIVASSDIPAKVISTPNLYYGASALLHPEIFEEISIKMETNLLILPSSVHELIVMPDDIGNANDYLDMVKTINGTEVSPEDRLSDAVYYYDRRVKEIVKVA